MTTTARGPSSPPYRRPDPPAMVEAVVVPHTHWDREWYAPFETMRFHLLRMLDDLVETLERDPDLPTFLLDGQVVILEDYLQVRRGQRARVEALVRAGRLRPGPFYVQPDEFHVSGESIVRNLLHGLAASRELGWEMREGYLPDTFGHVAQLPQILAGFGIDTFYAMRGFGLDVERTGSELWWEAPDGTRVLVEWLSESYSNAAVLAPDPASTRLHHGILVRYDDLRELLERLAARSRSDVVLLLNGGDHLRVQPDLPATVAGLDAGVPARLRLGGLEEFSALRAERAATGGRERAVVHGELRSGARHDVFESITSTRTPMKAAAERVQSLLCDVAERVDALAWRVDGTTSLDSLRHAWRELLKNHAHDSAYGCCVDEVHEEMATRFAVITQIAVAVRDDALERLARAVTAGRPSGAGAEAVPVVVVNLSGHARAGRVSVDVLPDLDAPLGERLFGWSQDEGVDFAGWTLRDAAGTAVPFSLERGVGYAVADPLDRRKELLRDRLTFDVRDLPPLSASVLHLVPEPAPAGATATTGPPSTEPVLDNGVLRAGFDPDGTVWIVEARGGRRHSGLLELLDDGDAGDTYGFGPLGDQPLTSRSAQWTVSGDPAAGALSARAALRVPAALDPDRRARSARTVELDLRIELSLAPGAERLDVTITVDNTARDHRLRLRVPTPAADGSTRAETAFGENERDADAVLPAPAAGWLEEPTEYQAMRRYVTARDASGAGLQVLTEGLYEYAVGRAPTGGRTVDVTMLRAVGWLARTDTPGRAHKVGPQVQVPGAQCAGRHHFRLALRPTGPQEGAGHRLRAAEEFALPLLAVAVQGRRSVTGSPTAPARPERAAGIRVEPAGVALTAFKVSEDGGAAVLRVVNASTGAVDAQLVVPGAAVAHECDLEERPGRPLKVVEGRIALALPAGRIATVRVAKGVDQ